jgi:hypothetical protein
MEAILKVALAGTSRSPDVGAALDDHPAAALVAQANIESREIRLLTAAGAVAVYQTCGKKLRMAVPPLEPAPAEPGTTASHRVGEFLNQTAAANDKPLLLESLRQLAAASLLLPHEFLPTALDYDDAELRAAIQPLVGLRGRWLSAFRKEWSWVNGPITAESDDAAILDRLWTEGTLDERRNVLAAWRRTARDESVNRLSDVWKTEKAETRAELLGAFEIGLAADDEPFLESALDDRSSNVRQLAARLLARLPTSQLSARMTARADAMLVGKTSGLIRKTFTLTVTPPQEIDAAWERDGIAAKPPGNVGKRAHWLTSTLALVRPSHWTERFKMDPPALLAAVAMEDFAAAAIDGWTQAAATFAPHDPASRPWLAPLVEHWIAQTADVANDAVRVALEHLPGLIIAMPPQEAEAAMMRIIELVPNRFDLLMSRLLPLVPTPWSKSFAQKLIVAARNAVRKFNDDRATAWVVVLNAAADAVPAELLTAELELWHVNESDTWQARTTASAVEKLTDRIRVRRTFRELLTDETKK